MEETGHSAKLPAFTIAESKQGSKRGIGGWYTCVSEGEGNSIIKEKLEVRVILSWGGGERRHQISSTKEVSTKAA